MRFQTKLLFSTGLLLALSLSAAGLAQWGVMRAHTYLERSHLAHEQLELHLQLSRDSYKLFKQWTDALLTGLTQKPVDTEGLAQSIKGDLDQIRASIDREIRFVDQTEKPAEGEELRRLDAIQRQVNLTFDTLKNIDFLHREGRYAEAWLRLSAVLKSDVDEGLNRLIAEATADEHSEVARTDAEAARLLSRLDKVARGHAVLAILVTVVFTLVLLQRLRRPLAELLKGTRALAGGNLEHRIPIHGGDEFAGLGASFNQMAADLQSNRDALALAQARLETAVAERTEELRHANAALRQVDDARRGFFADISHELRTPLTIIRGEAEIALRGRNKKILDYKNSLQRIVEQSRHTSHLIDDLLFIARHGEGGNRIEMQPVEIGSLLEDACGDARVMADDRGIRVRCRCGDTNPMIGDPQRLRQLFLILLDNAIRYSNDEGEVDVEMSQMNGEVTVRVSDSGIGIREDEIGLVFERFRRGGNAVEHNADGMGLGLPVAKAIVEAHQGAIVIESRIGEGTRAIVHLPAEPHEAAAS